MRETKQNFIDILKANNHSVTVPRLLVFEALYTYGLQSIRLLIGRCKPCNRASVYRAVALLESIGIINRVPQGFKYKLELSESFIPHHHHIVCSSCGRHSDVEQSKLEDLLSSIALAEGYELVSHKIELSGICHDCQNHKTTDQVLG